MGKRHIGTFQMLWDCSCGAGPLLGVDHRHCPGCGRPQDPERRYFPDQRNAVPAPQWLLGGARGPDLSCPHCTSPNAKANAFCANCGAPLSGATPVPARRTNYGTSAETIQAALSEAQERRRRRREAQRAPHRKAAVREPLTPGRPRPTQPDKASSAPPALKDRASLQKLKDHQGLLLALTGAFGFVVILWALFSWEKPVSVEVVGREWSRVQEVEAYVPQVHARWCTDRAPDAYDISESRRQRGTKTVVDCRDCDCHNEKVRVGETCREVNCRTIRQDNRDGTFDVDTVCDEECDPKYEKRRVCQDRVHEEPVYGAWCTYRVNRWVPQRSIVLSGTAEKKPLWPSPVLNACESEVGCERLGKRREEYQVFLQDLTQPDTYECQYPEHEWKAFEEGSQWVSTVKVLGGSFQCDGLQWKAGGNVERAL